CTTSTPTVVRYCCSFFFFFQAEDGIRDRNVTGVQTCALPIFPLPLVAGPSPVSDQSPALPKFQFITDLNRYGGGGVGAETSTHEIGRAACREREEIAGGDEVGKKSKGGNGEEDSRKRTEQDER